jgi:hypothetical protein
VYQSKEEAMEDLARLIKLGDGDGIKLRVMQIYRERGEIERIFEEIEYKVIANMKDAIEARDKAIQDIHSMALSS